MRSFINPKVELLKNTATFSISKKEPFSESIIQNKAKRGRPPKYTVDQIVKKFKKYIKSKNNLVKNPSLLFNRRLLLEAMGNKEHWFWSAKHLPKRIKELENKWYGSERSIICFLLEQSGWFSKEEAIKFSKELELIAKKSSAKKISENAKRRLKDRDKKNQIRLKVKLKWKDKNYKNKILEKMVFASLKARQLKRKSSVTQAEKNIKSLDKNYLIKHFFKKNHKKIFKLQKSLTSSPSLVKIDNRYREWILENFENNGNIARYAILPPLVGVYLLYCQKQKKIVNFEKLAKIDLEFYQIFTKLYKDELEVLEKVLKLKPDLFIFIYTKK